MRLLLFVAVLSQDRFETFYQFTAFLNLLDVIPRVWDGNEIWTAHVWVGGPTGDVLVGTKSDLKRPSGKTRILAVRGRTSSRRFVDCRIF